MAKEAPLGGRNDNSQQELARAFAALLCNIGVAARRPATASVDDGWLVSKAATRCLPCERRSPGEPINGGEGEGARERGGRPPAPLRSSPAPKLPHTGVAGREGGIACSRRLRRLRRLRRELAR